MATMTTPMTNHVDGFREAMLAAGLTPPDQIEPGGFHRFPGIGKKKGNKAGWCKMFPDGMGGTFGDYSTDLYSAWQAKRDRPMTTEEAEIFKQEVVEARRQAERERQARQAVAAEKAAAIWEQAKPAREDHPYLLNKGCLSHGLRQTDNGKLVVPMRDTGGKLHSLQHIDKDGGKLFLLDGRVSGCYFFIGKPIPGGPVCIAEGFATAASIHQATGYPVAVAFNTGNLKAVAEAIRKKLPETRLILCADDDAATDGNPGIAKATEGALAVGGCLAVPDFGPERPEGVTDFNDLHANYGKEKVAACIEAAQMVTKDVGQATPTPTDTVPDIEQEREPANDDATIQRLVALSPLQYDRERREMAKSLGVRPSTLDKMVQAARKEEETDTGLVFDDLEPWSEPVDGAMLLADIQEMFAAKSVDRISTADLIAALCEDEEKPWSTYNRGVQIKPRQVSSRLAEYGIRSNTIRVGINTPKGFMREHFEEAFSRYLASPPSASATPPQPVPVKVSGVADETQRCGNETLSATRKPAPDKGCGGVADRMGGMDEKEKITVTI